MKNLNSFLGTTHWVVVCLVGCLYLNKSENNDDNDDKNYDSQRKFCKYILFLALSKFIAITSSRYQENFNWANLNFMNE